MKIKILEPFKELFNPKWRNLVFYGGRGAGRSWNIAYNLIIKSLTESCLILCVRQFQNSIAESVKGLLEKRIKFLELEDNFKITDKDITSSTNSKFVFKGIHNHPESIQSMEAVKYCWLEEARTANKRGLDILTPTIRIPGSQIIYSFNPMLKDDPVYKKFVDTKVLPERTFVRKVNYDENPFFKESPMYEEMLYDREHDEDNYLWKWEGHCKEVTEASVFKGKIKVEKFNTPIDAVFYQGLDPGFSQSYLAFIRCFVDHKNRKIYIDKAGRKKQLEIEDTPRFLEQVIPGSKKWIITCDNARPELISFLRKKRFRIKPAKKGKDSVIEGVEFLRSFTIIIHENLRDVAEEFFLYSYQIDKHTEQILPILQKENDHYIDALRYATEDLRFKPLLYVAG